MKRLLVLPVLLLTLIVGNFQPRNATAQTVNLAVEVIPSTQISLGAVEVEIIPPTQIAIGAEQWEVIGGCSNQPNLKIEIVPPTRIAIGARQVEIISPSTIALNVTRVCITNPNDLDEETLRQLGLID